MNLTEIRIIKRDGKQENFSAAKITNAIGKAFEATGIPQQREELDLITRQVVSHYLPSVWKKFRTSWKTN